MKTKSAPPPLDQANRRWALLCTAVCVLPLLLQLPAVLSVPIALTAAVVFAAGWRQNLSGWVRVLLTLTIVGVLVGLAGFRFGRDTGCALLAAMLAIKPAETQRLRDARSLVGFALFAPFATFLLDQGPLSLLLGLVAATLALMALQRFADLESGDVRSAVSIWHRLRSVAHLLLIGLPLTLSAFWLFPRLGTPLWGVPERAMGRPGLSDSMRPGEWQDMLTDDSAALRVRFFGPAPTPREMYWRGPVLWDFDGETWTQPRWARDWHPAAAQTASLRWDYELEIEPTDRRQLVALDLPTVTPEDAALGIDHNLKAALPLTSLTRLRLQSAPPTRYQLDLPPAMRTAALTLPPGFNPRTLALAQQWRRDAGANDLAIVRRYLDWIHRDFAYTLDTPPWGRNAIDEFLFDTRAGFCQHFSSSFVVLMRAAGIPARVVAGYAGGYRNRLGDYWLVRRSDAHAWAEVWLQGRGWVRIDPTAAVAPERIYDTLAERAPGADGLFGDLGLSVWNVNDWLRRGWNDFVLGFNAARQAQLLRPFGVDRLDSRELVLLFAFAAVVAISWMVWLSARGQREADPLLRAWHRMSRRYRPLGLERAPHEPASDWAERVRRTRPDLGQALAELSHRFVNWRYAHVQPAQSSDREANDLIRALRAHRPLSSGDRT